MMSSQESVIKVKEESEERRLWANSRANSDVKRQDVEPEDELEEEESLADQLKRRQALTMKPPPACSEQHFISTINDVPEPSTRQTLPHQLTSNIFETKETTGVKQSPFDFSRKFGSSTVPCKTQRSNGYESSSDCEPQDSEYWLQDQDCSDQDEENVIVPQDSEYWLQDQDCSDQDEENVIVSSACERLLPHSTVQDHKPASKSPDKNHQTKTRTEYKQTHAQTFQSFQQIKAVQTIHTRQRTDLHYSNNSLHRLLTGSSSASRQDWTKKMPETTRVGQHRDFMA